MRVCWERIFFFNFSRFLRRSHHRDVLLLLFWVSRHQKVSIFPGYSVHFPKNAILTLFRDFYASLRGAQFFSISQVFLDIVIGRRYYFSCLGPGNTKKFRFFLVFLSIFLGTRYSHSLDTSMRVCRERGFLHFSRFLRPSHHQEVLLLLFWVSAPQKVSIFPTFPLQFSH